MTASNESASGAEASKDAKGRDLWGHGELSDENIFATADMVTTDPSEVDDVWVHLSQSSLAWTIRNLPAIMHHALVETLKRRGYGG